MPRKTHKEIFLLEAARENGKIKVSACEKSSEDEKTIRHYELLSISDREVNTICSSVIDIFSRDVKRGKKDGTALQQLQVTGQLLYDSLLTSHVKNKLSATTARNLLVSVDEHLVHIPWELLFDGQSFLCRKFNMGRAVSTSQKISNSSVRKIEKPMKMLLVADPRGDLEASHNEGVRLRDELDKNHKTVEVDFRSSLVDTKFLKGVLRNYDIVHYAGHADYNVTNPSQSGFLLQDGKLTASDIMSMTGPAPLPSLIFSNACKTGMTDPGKVSNDYATEIYGLANAFLLAGVQHYIGTFWDIQDEPGQYFALYFYRELMKGTIIGEAMRKARFELTQRYGDNTIIWASYMLYGDPTVRYAERIYEEESTGSPGGSSSSKDKNLSVKAGMRSGNEMLVFPQKKQKWIVAGAAIILLLAAIVLLVTGNKTGNSNYFNTTVVFQENPLIAKKERIDKLVASLLKKYEENRKTGADIVARPSQSRLPTLVFLDIKAQGVTDMDRQFIFSRISEILHNSRRVDVIEREVLDALLEELNLSASNLTDLSTAVKVGRILSAKLITVGSILRQGNYWQVSLRLIETETSSIKAALTETMNTGNKAVIAEKLSKEIMNKVRREYPLRGKILSIEENNVVLDKGFKDGITSGLIMDILYETEGIVTKAGEIKIISVDKKTSIANIIKRRDEIKKGFEVEEII